MQVPINYREKFTPVQPKESNFVSEEATEETDISDLKTPVKELIVKFAPVIYILIGMLVMGAIASYGYGNKYENLMTAIERREELLGKMEYNNNVIKDKVAENATIRNQVLSDNEMMVEAIKNANQVKESKIVEK